jgi:methylase of polypeptide subunit release factors
MGSQTERSEQEATKRIHEKKAWRGLKVHATRGSHIKRSQSEVLWRAEKPTSLTVQEFTGTRREDLEDFDMM